MVMARIPILWWHPPKLISAPSINCIANWNALTRKCKRSHFFQSVTQLMKYARFLDFTHYVLTRFFQHNCTQVASSLTFTTLLSLVPFIAIALSIVAAFPAFAEY